MSDPAGTRGVSGYELSYADDHPRAAATLDQRSRARITPALQNPRAQLVHVCYSLEPRVHRAARTLLSERTARSSENTMGGRPSLVNSTPRALLNNKLVVGPGERTFLNTISTFAALCLQSRQERTRRSPANVHGDQDSSANHGLVT